MADPTEAAIVLLSGMGADASVFAAQQAAFSTLQTPLWLRPEWEEDLDTYCARLAQSLAPRAERLVLGGASFGGVAAQQMAERLRPACLVLIGSMRSPEEYPWWLRALRPIAPLARLLPVGVVQRLVAPLACRWVASRSPQVAAVARQFIRADSRLLRWSVRELLRWRGAAEPPCPLFRIHGARDRLVPADRIRDAVLLDTGGHVLSMTHPAEVNELLREAVAAASSPS